MFGVQLPSVVQQVAVDPVRRRTRRPERDHSELLQWAFEVGDSPSSLRTYRVVHWLCRSLLHPYLRVRTENTEVLDRSGPMVLAPVHRSHLDTVLVATSCRRRLRALGKESLFQTPFVGWVCAALGAIPVRRGEADREALKAAKSLLERGEPMFVFPEGGRYDPSGRNDANTVQDLYDGAAWLAARTGAVVVPIGIAGSGAALGPGAKWLRRSHVAVAVGEPMPAPVGADGGKAKRPDLTAFTEELQKRLQAQQNRAVALSVE